jgi:hypothetical protein
MPTIRSMKATMSTMRVICSVEAAAMTSWLPWKLQVAEDLDGQRGEPGPGEEQRGVQLAETRR